MTSGVSVEPAVAFRAAVAAHGLRRPGRAPRIRREGSTVERDYLSQLDALVARIGAIIEKRVLPALPALTRAYEQGAPRGDNASGLRQDSFRDELMATIRGVNVTVGTVLRIERIARQVAGAEAKQNARTTERILRAVTGVAPIINDTRLAELVGVFANENARLIKGATESYIDTVAKVIEEGLRAGLRAEQLEAKLKAEFVAKVGPVGPEASAQLKRRMRLIARDQLGKLNAELSSTRQQSLGVTHFFWRTARDERVRGAPVVREGQTIGGAYPKAVPSHAALEGQRFAWAGGANGLIPGQPINCRCYAEPDLGVVFQETNEQVRR